MKVGILVSKSSNNYGNFMKIYLLLKKSFEIVQVLTEDGRKPPEFDQEEEEDVDDLEYRSYTTVDSLENDFDGLVIPDGLGHYNHNNTLKPFIQSFLESKNPICLIGTGCAALLVTKPDLDEDWMFADYSLTTPSNLDLLKTKSYDKYPSLEEFVILNFGQYSASTRSKSYIVVDDHLVTAQNEASTVMAIQTFILLFNT